MLRQIFLKGLHARNLSGIFQFKVVYSMIFRSILVVMRIWFIFFLGGMGFFVPYLGIAQCSVGVGPELVINGHFDAGMVGFTSDVIQGPVNCCADRWELGTNANLLHPSFTGVGSPTAMFFVCNGPTVTKRAWIQTVAVSSGTNYVFAANICNVIVHSANSVDPILRLTINGVPVTAAVAVPELPDIWVPLCAVWNSAGATSAVLAVETMSPAPGGNDLGIDSISFKLETILPKLTEPLLSGHFEEAAQTVYLAMDFPEIGGRFEVQNSEDGLAFGKVVDGKVLEQGMKLRLIDAQFGSFWRLMWEDALGFVTYSSVIEIHLELADGEVFVYPNPLFAGEMLRLRGANGTIKMTNQMGKTWTVRLTDQFLPTESLRAGIYLITGFSEAGNPFATRIVIQSR